MSNKSYTTVLADAERDALPSVSVSATNLEAARAALADAERASEVATEALEGVEDSIASGDESVTASHLAEAEAGYKYAALRLSGAEKRAKAAERSLKHSDTRLAESVAASLRATFPGALVLPTWLAPKDVPEPTDRHLPVLVVSQTGEADVRSNGLLSGMVECSYYRSGQIHRSLDAGEVLAALRGDGAGVDRRSSLATANRPGGTKIDRQGFTIHSAHPVVPVLGTVSERDVLSLGDRLAAKVAGVRRYSGHAIRVQALADGLASHSTTHGEIVASEAVILSDTVTDGERTIVADLLLAHRDHGQAHSAGSSAEVLSDIASGMVGSFAPGIGRVTSVEIASESDLAPEDSVAYWRKVSAVRPGSADLRERDKSVGLHAAEFDKERAGATVLRITATSQTASEAASAA